MHAQRQWCAKRARAQAGMLTRIVENISRGKSCAMSGASLRRRARGLTSAETSLQNSTTRACARRTGQRVKKFGLRHRGDAGAQGHPLCDRGSRGVWEFVQKWPVVCEARLARDHLLRVEDGLARSCPARALALLCDIGGDSSWQRRRAVPGKRRSLATWRHRRAA